MISGMLRERYKLLNDQIPASDVYFISDTVISWVVLTFEAFLRNMFLAEKVEYIQGSGK